MLVQLDSIWMLKRFVSLLILIVMLTTKRLEHVHHATKDLDFSKLHVFQG